MQSNARAKDILRAIGMSPKYKGYVYVRHMLHLAIEDSTRMQNMTERLYTEVCTRYRVTRVTVERNARFTIRRTWEADSSGKMHRIFAAYGIYYAPTNREFLCVLADFAL